ncbi:MAG TPA: hypothetical protein DIV41_05965 [Ruminococcaceae bacterium]|mgnify:FL=1|nr:hypothetical protein [Oscillospiraceae bacterium]
MEHEKLLERNVNNENIKKAVACTIMCALLITCTLGANAVSDDGSGETQADFSTGLYMTSTPIEVVDINKPVDGHDTLDELGKVTYKKTVIIDGKKNLLSYTFDDPSEALANVKEKDKDVLEKMSDKFGLDELTADNWQDYKDVLDQHAAGVLFDNKTDYDDTIMPQRDQLYAFFGSI